MRISLKNKPVLTPQNLEFIVGCIVLGLEYIHSRNIIHRDLKPENLVFQEEGYIRITDFGVARKHKSNNSEETSGTPGYMAPEVICRMNHSFESDFFALGVMIYEMMLGVVIFRLFQRPYLGDSRKQIRQKIMGHQAKVTARQLPNGWSTTCIDFVNRLLKRNRESRLGYNGIHQLKSHEWLKSINWSKLQRKQIRPPFCPGVKIFINIQIISESLEYQRQIETSTETQIDEQTAMLIKTTEIQKLFKPYEDIHHQYLNRKPKRIM